MPALSFHPIYLIRPNGPRRYTLRGGGGTEGRGVGGQKFTCALGTQTEHKRCLLSLRNSMPPHNRSRSPWKVDGAVWLVQPCQCPEQPSDAPLASGRGMGDGAGGWCAGGATCCNRAGTWTHTQCAQAEQQLVATHIAPIRFLIVVNNDCVVDRARDSPHPKGPPRQMSKQAKHVRHCIV